MILVANIMGWAGHVARMVEKRGVYRGFGWGNLRERRPLGLF